MQQNTDEMSSRKRYKVSGTRLYYAAAVCLVLVAAVLRFYDLPADSLDTDESVAVLNSRGSLGEVLDNTRYANSSPILYPIVLWAVQKVESSPVSVRIVPAVASVLTIVALLFLLPRVGVSLWASFIAALLATGSFHIIENARDTREYSLDTMIAVLMIAGLLSYLRGKHRGWGYVLFCASLFVAPLVQYGLILFGIAIFGTIAVIEGKILWSRRVTLRDDLRFPTGWVWNELVYFAWPAASFAAGFIISYAVTLRYHFVTESFGRQGYLYRSYYQGEYTDARSLIEFVLGNTWEMLRFYLPEPTIALGLAAVCMYLIMCVGKIRSEPIIVLFLFSMVITVYVAVIAVYPLGYTRQNMYLTPIIFLTFAHSIYSIVDSIPLRSIRPYVVRLGMLLASGLIVFGAFTDVRDGAPYNDHTNVAAIVDALEDEIQNGDHVYFTTHPAIMTFYRQRFSDNYHYHWGTHDGGCEDETNLRGCIDHVVEIVDTDTDRLWIIGYERQMPKIQMLEELHGEFHDMDAVHLVKSSDSGAQLYLLEAPHLFDRLRKPLGNLKREGELIANSTFEVYLREDSLAYIKEPCGLDDLEALFFLHITPANVLDLPDDRKQYGFDNLDFDFLSYGTVLDDKCVAVRQIPQYEIKHISAGQHSEEGQIWQVEFRVGFLEAMEEAYQYAAHRDPVVQSVFDLYRREGSLIYVKEPCTDSDIADRFFLHVTPRDLDDLPDDRGQHGFDNLDFDFSSFGIVADGRCIAIRDLPHYNIHRISTGQFTQGEQTWSAEFSPDEQEQGQTSY